MRRGIAPNQCFFPSPVKESLRFAFALNTRFRAQQQGNIRRQLDSRRQNKAHVLHVTCVHDAPARLSTLAYKYRAKCPSTSTFRPAR